MCGRFAFFSPSEAIAAAFGLDELAVLKPRFNIAPSQDIFTVRIDAGQIIADRCRWGLVPFWAKDPAIGNRMINARAETLAEKPSFRQALRRRRCLIPADGFFEWQINAAGKKQPWYISAADSQLLGFAGLWEEWRAADGTQLRSCTIITTVASDFMRKLHHRMPVILPPAQYGAWLNPDAASAATDALLAAMPAAALQAWPVSREVNNPVNDAPSLVDELKLA